MNFYDQYAQICAKKGIEPCGQKAADMFGVTRATISSWNKKNNAPKGETVAVIADTLNVSADYLLGRTDDPTDHARLIHEVVQELTGRATKSDEPQNKDNENYKNIKNTNSYPEILTLYNRLDAEDRIKIEGVIQGMLLSDKYRKKQNLA